MSYKEDWQEALDYCIANKYYATATALREDGPQPNIDYQKLIEKGNPDDNNPTQS